MRLQIVPLLVAGLLAADASAQTCSTLPNLFIVQDRSGSMTGSPDPANCPYCASKWSIARTAITNMTTQYSGQFQFGLAMYPAVNSSNSCATGGTVAAIGTAVSTINSIYNQTSPGGGTPTSASLNAARTYLQSLGVTAPTHVLLMTDGMPNCNASIGTSYLDDAATRTAAQNLKNAGFKVYVVGFGSGTAGNNKAVLDGIAAAGGTGTAYSAMDQTSLSNALAAIAGQISTCCTNTCTVGAAQCTANGQKQTCVQGTNGCSSWTTENCAAGNECRNGACTPCANQCSAGAQKCEDRVSYQCVTQPSSCTVWEPISPCQQGQACVGGSCGSCVTCTEGASRCAGNVAEVCTKDAVGCTKWQQSESCASFCSGGVCGACGPACTVGAKRCNGETVETCAVDSNGCSAFTATQACASDKACGGGECLSKCTIGELATCEEPGFICQPSASGGFCVRDPNGATVPPEQGGGETITPSATSPAPSTTQKSSDSYDVVSTGCTASAGPALVLLALMTSALARRRRRS